MDVLIGAVFVIVLIFIIAAISDSRSKAELKRIEKANQIKREIEEKRLEELRKQREEQEKKRLEEERKKEKQRLEEERRIEEKRKEEQRLFNEKVNIARKNDPATFFPISPLELPNKHYLRR